VQRLGETPYHLGALVARHLDIYLRQDRREHLFQQLGIAPEYVKCLVEELPLGEKWDAVRDRVKRAATAENIVTYDQDIAAWVADYGEEGGPS